MIQHREIRIVYESAGSGQSRRTVQPLKLSYKSKEWYLKAFCLERQDFRLFKLNRILDLELLEGTFEMVRWETSNAAASSGAVARPLSKR